MDYKQILIFNSNNKELQMHKNSDFRNIEIQGIEASSYTINTTSSEYDGADITSKKIEPREVTITGDIRKNENELKNRDFLIRFFDPKETGELIIKRNNIERKMQYEVSSLDFPTNKMHKYIEFTLVLESIDEPYLIDSKNSGSYLTSISRQFTFPFVSLVNRPKIMGYKTFKPVMPLINDGDKETGIEIVATAKRGKVDNLKLILNNNEFIRIPITLKQGDILIINTNPRKKGVTLNGKKITKWDRESTFFSLKKGKNILKYECENGESNIDIEVLFFRKFLGI